MADWLAEPETSCCDCMIDILSVSLPRQQDPYDNEMSRSLSLLAAARARCSSALQQFRALQPSASSTAAGVTTNDSTPTSTEPS
jgi:hypothetical protein